MRDLLTGLKQEPAVEHAAYFGAAVHISGQDGPALEKAISHWRREGIHWERIEPGLEDVFIALMKRAGKDVRQSA